MTPLLIIVGYLGLLLGLGLLSGRAGRGTAKDYFLASHSIGPFLLLMSVFGTTMTAFAMVGSTGEAFRSGIGVYGKMASWSGLIHSAVFFLVGMKLWAIGRRNGYVTQVQFFRDRFESNGIGYLLFPILVALVVPYLLTGLLGSGSVIQGVTRGTFPDLFPDTNGAVPPWLTNAVICMVVLTYVFVGGLRGATWANTFQTLVFMVMGVVTMYIIASRLGGPAAAAQAAAPELLVREGQMTQAEFMTYMFVPLSVGMFPHLFQHWLTAKSAKTFRLTVIAFPVCIMLVWVPCILLGIWASGATMPNGAPLIPDTATPNQVLGIMVNRLTSPLLTGFLTAGILAAIMSSLDSQFFCLGTMFTNDVVVHHFGRERFTDRQKVLLARGFIVGIVLVTYLLSLAPPRHIFQLGVWCFSGFAGLFPLVFAAVHWKRVTKPGAIASILGAAGVWTILFAESGFGAKPEHLVLGVMPVTFIVLAAVVGLVGVSLVTQPPSNKTLAKFFPPEKSPKAEETVGNPTSENG
jgi:solute:Na+ symporter, SSS family